MHLQAHLADRALLPAHGCSAFALAAGAAARQEGAFSVFFPAPRNSSLPFHDACGAATLSKSATSPLRLGSVIRLHLRCDELEHFFGADALLRLDEANEAGRARETGEISDARMATYAVRER